MWEIQLDYGIPITGHCKAIKDWDQLRQSSTKKITEQNTQYGALCRGGKKILLFGCLELSRVFINAAVQHSQLLFSREGIRASFSFLFWIFVHISVYCCMLFSILFFYTFSGLSGYKHFFQVLSFLSSGFKLSYLSWHTQQHVGPMSVCSCAVLSVGVDCSSEPRGLLLPFHNQPAHHGPLGHIIPACCYHLCMDFLQVIPQYTWFQCKTESFFWSLKK